MNFSERIGKRQPRTELQIDAMDDDLRTSIWNAINIYLNEPLREKIYSESLTLAGNLKTVIHAIWSSFLKKETDYLSDKNSYTITAELKSCFNEMDYLRVYELTEFLANCPYFPSEPFVYEINSVLKREFSAYRFVNKILVPITNENEIQQIEEALHITSVGSLKGVHIHLKEATSKLSDKRNPDFRNSIKESISAVEALCQIITNKKSELSKALFEIKSKIPLHPALLAGFEKIYAYTSDGDGIRHALMNEPNLDQEDALYMLVSCSAFVNYLIVKTDKAGIKIITE